MLADVMILYHELFHPVFAADEDVRQFLRDKRDSVAARVRGKAKELVSQRGTRPRLLDVFAEREIEGMLWTVIEQWAAEFFCDFGAAALAGPSFLFGALLYDCDLPGRGPAQSQLQFTHPPMGLRHSYVASLLRDNGWACLISEAPVVSEWLGAVEVPSTTLHEQKGDEEATRIVKFAGSLVVDEYLDDLRAKVLCIIDPLPRVFRSCADRCKRLWDERRDGMSDGELPFIYTPDVEPISPLDVVNVCALFLLSGRMDAEWSEYPDAGRPVCRREARIAKLTDMMLKNMEDVLVVCRHRGLA